MTRHVIKLRSRKEYRTLQKDLLVQDMHNLFRYACNDADCVCRRDKSWPDNIATGCQNKGESP